MENIYQKTLRLADEALARKRSRQWATDDILDPEDFEALSNGAIRSRARRIFKSLPANPHTKILDIPLGQLGHGMDVPRDSILQMLDAVLAEQQPTQRQQQALKAEIEALQANHPPVKYTAAKLDIKPNSASELLKRAKIRLFEQKVHVMSEDVVSPDKWSPSRVDIRRKMASKQRVCAYCGQSSWASTKRICHDCYQFSISKPEEWRERTQVIKPGQTEPWFIQEIRRIENAHYRWAVNELYREHYGTTSLQVYEQLMDAA